MDPSVLAMLMQQQFQGAAGNFLGGITGNSAGPYEDASKQYQQYFNQGQQAQQPYQQAGQQGLGQYQNWLNTPQNPSGFINNLMSQYHQSPFAQFQQQQGIRAAQNLGSATGLTGSTPLQFQAQQNAQNISSEDMQKWLGNVLGINTQYGGGLQNLVTGGQGAANSLTGLNQHFGDLQGDAAYGREAGKNQDTSNWESGLLHLFL